MSAAPDPGGRLRRRHRLTLAVGVGALVTYVGVLLATAALSDRPLRPLFDGFSPPAPYRWVNPPPGFEADNQAPARASNEIRLDPARGSEVSNASTSDTQAVAALELGSVPPNPPDSSVRLDLSPIDPATLGAPPDGLRVLSNAYQVTATYQPSATPVNAFDPPGTVAVTAAAPSDTLLFSSDGRTWEPVAARPYGVSYGQFAELTAPGYFLVASSQPAPAAHGSGGSSTGLVIALGLIPVVGAAILLRGRRPKRRRPRRR